MNKALRGPRGMPIGCGAYVGLLSFRFAEAAASLGLPVGLRTPPVDPRGTYNLWNEVDAN